MAYKDPRFVEVYQEIKEHRQELQRVEKELRHAKSRKIKRELELHIGDLKWDIACSLFNCGEYAKALAIVLENLWRSKIYRHWQCTGGNGALRRGETGS
jgi:hypothetical protein